MIISILTVIFVFFKNRQDLQQPIKINAYEKLIDSISFTEGYISKGETNKDKIQQSRSYFLDAVRHLTIIAPHKILSLCHELRVIKMDTKEDVEEFEKIREKILHEIRKDLKVNKSTVALSKLIK